MDAFSFYLDCTQITQPLIENCYLSLISLRNVYSVNKNRDLPLYLLNNEPLVKLKGLARSYQPKHSWTRESGIIALSTARNRNEVAWTRISYMVILIREIKDLLGLWAAAGWVSSIHHLGHKPGCPFPTTEDWLPWGRFFSLPWWEIQIGAKDLVVLWVRLTLAGYPPSILSPVHY